MGCQPLPMLMPLGNTVNLHLFRKVILVIQAIKPPIFGVVCELWTKYNGEVSVHSEPYTILPVQITQRCALLQTRKLIIVIPPQQVFLMQFILNIVAKYIVIRHYTSHLISKLKINSQPLFLTGSIVKMNLLSGVCIFYKSRKGFKRLVCGYVNIGR